jgi:hypothetical protein
MVLTVLRLGGHGNENIRTDKMLSFDEFIELINMSIGDNGLY